MEVSFYLRYMQSFIAYHGVKWKIFSTKCNISVLWQKINDYTSLTRFSNPPVEPSEVSVFNETLYRTALFTRMIPLCSQTHPEDWLESTSRTRKIQDACSDFVPSFSNHGFCVTRNRDKLETIFNENSHMKSFLRTFIPTKHANSKEYNFNARDAVYAIRR